MEITHERKDLGERPPCPKCGSRHIYGHGAYWECANCCNLFIKRYMDLSEKQKSGARPTVLGARPPCPKCGNIRVMASGKSHGRQRWECICGKIWMNNHVFMSHNEREILYKKGLKKCFYCNQIKPLSDFYDSDSVYCKECRTIMHRKRTITIKIEVMTHYCNGVPKCQCEYGCSETNIRFLTIDHINNDGYKEREWGHNIYRNIIKANFPEGKYRVLCYNCNLGREHNNGVCPHKDYMGDS